MNRSRERGAWGAAIAVIVSAGALVATRPMASDATAHAGTAAAHPGTGTAEPVRIAAAESAKPKTSAASGGAATGLTETAGITLTLLDVEVRDAQGRPMRGLRKEDFKVKLGIQEWPIYSVDDLCTCSEPDVTPVEENRADAHGPAPEGPARAPQEVAKPPSPGPDAAPEPAQAKGSTAPSAASAAVLDPLRYVFFFDLGGLQVNGRYLAFREARRWLREVKKPADEVMIAGYTEQRGLVEVSSFTSDASHLLEALDRAESDATLQDSFPSGVESRVKECQDDTARCLEFCAGMGGKSPEIACSECFPTVYCQTLARDEYVHGRNSLLGLKDLLVDLESVPGRKALLHFQQNGTVFPGRIYNDRTRRTDDQVHLMDELGAEANLSRTAIHGAYAGDRLGARGGWEQEVADQSVTLASNLADFTGGTYGRDLNALKGLTTAVRQDCACTYRLGLEPPSRPDDRIYTAHVEVRGRPLPHGYRVVFLDEAARWMRQALAVLRNPEHKSQLSIGAALVPGGYSEKKGYSVRVQVAFELDELAMTPGRGGRTGSWEAGALLASDDGAKQWDLLSVSNVKRSGGGESSAPDTTGNGTATFHPGTETPPRSGSVVLHERVFEGLASGRYTLRAFVRDRTSLLIGGASAILDLPQPGRDGLSGPEIFYPSRRHLVAGLPLFTKKETAEGRISETRTGEVPAPSTVPSGESLEAVTWICPRETHRSPKGAPKIDAGADGVSAKEHGASDDAVRAFAADVTSDLRREGGEAVALTSPHVTRDGACYRVGDALVTGTLAPGSYTYAIHWKSSGSSKPRTAEAHFVLGPTAGPQDPAVETAPQPMER